MKLIPNAWRILATSYAIWTFIFIAALTVAPDAIYLATGVDTAPGVWSALLLGGCFAGCVLRLIDQRPEGRWARRAMIALLLVIVALWAIPAAAFETPRNPATQGNAPDPMAQPEPGPSYSDTATFLVPFVQKWEGKHPCPDSSDLHCAYLDTIAEPDICTVGYGHTENCSLDMRLTDRDALELLKVDLRRYWSGTRLGFTPETIAARLAPRRDAAYASLAYNVGISGVRKSTATRRLNAGDIEGGCEAIGWWNKAGGRVVRGLVNRRAEEVALCKWGLST